MKPTPLIAGNWKMNLLPSEAVRWVSSFIEQLEQVPHAHAEILLNVPFTHLLPLADIAEGTPVRLGAQDLSPHPAGAYTGEVSAAMLRDAGSRFVIVGHSERRAYHAEDDTLVNAKVSAAHTEGLTPILCVGESESQRDAGEALTVVLKQLEADLSGLSLSSPSELVIAYEPIWAIGTGKTASADDAQEMCASIRTSLRRLYPSLADDLRVLYGGSMNPGNAGELLLKPDINGGLIGGASLKIDSLLAIIESAA
jgi:triosephosphate isomerase